jgi:hypothetical protein
MVSRVCDGLPLLLPHEGPIRSRRRGPAGAPGRRWGGVHVGNAAWYWTAGDVIGPRLAAA